MREIQVSAITDVVERLCIEANTHLPKDVKCAIETCRACEDSSFAQSVLDKILENWEQIREIFCELPSAGRIGEILDIIDAPKSCEDIGISRQLLPMTVKAAKDIRDKYVLARLLWDLGILDEFAEAL